MAGRPLASYVVLNRLDLRGRNGDELVAELPRPDPGGEGPTEAVRAIVAEVRAGGDSAIRSLTEKFDGVNIADSRVSREALLEALATIPSELADALTGLGWATSAAREVARDVIRDSPTANLSERLKIALASLGGSS